MLYVQDDEHLAERLGSWNAPAWQRHGSGEHSVEAKARELRGYLDRGGIAVGALVERRLVGIGVVVPHLLPRIAQLAFLHVGAPKRGTGIGSRLSAELDDIARRTGDREIPPRNNASPIAVRERATTRGSAMP